MLHEFIVNMNFHIVRCREVSHGRFRPHRHKAVTERGIICKCERLISIVSVMFTENDLTYLIISCNKIGHCMQGAGSRELSRSNHGFKSQMLLAITSITLGCFRLGYFRWSRPVIHTYFSFFTPLLVDFIMLTDMEAIRRITSLMECLSYSIQFDKIYVITIFLLYSCVIYLPAKITPSSLFRNNLIIILEIYCHPIGHYGEDVKSRIFFNGFFIINCPALMLVKAIPLKDL
jgi:hypothetical protein